MEKQASLTLETEQSERPVEQLPSAPSSDSLFTVLALIEKVALDPHADVAKLKRVMGMYEGRVGRRITGLFQCRDERGLFVVSDRARSIEGGAG